MNTMENSYSLHALLQAKRIWHASAPSQDSSPLAPCPTTQSHANPQQALSLTVSEIDVALPDRGLKTGALHEFFSSDPFLPTRPLTIPTLIALQAHREALLALEQNRWHATSKAHRPKEPALPLRSTVWIGRECWPSPHFLIDREVWDQGDMYRSTSMLTHSLFVDPPSDKLTLWAIETALQSSSVSLVVAACPTISRTTSQRLAHTAKQGDTTALLLRQPKDITKASYAHSRWEVTPYRTSNETPHWTLCLQRMKGSGLRDYRWHVALAPYDFFNVTAPSLTLCAEESTTVRHGVSFIDNSALVRHG